MFIGIILVLGMGSYYLYTQNQTLSANNIALEYAVEEQKATMNALKENFEKQTAALQNMSRKNAEIEEDKARYLSIHNFERLATVKPGLMETRFNKGTVEVIEGIENDTKDISNLESINDTSE